MTRDELRAYYRGYNAGSRGRWPEHRPPRPPDHLAAGLMTAARRLRDGVDAELAKLDEGDSFVQALGPLVDDLDGVLADVSAWLRYGEPLA